MNFLAGILLFLLVKSGSSLICYKCSNLDNEKGCQDDVTECTTSDVNPFCMKTVGQTKARQIVLKGCGGFALRKPVNECGKSTEIGGLKATMCVCTTDLCNNANTEKMSKLLMICLVFVTALIIHSI